MFASAPASSTRFAALVALIGLALAAPAAATVDRTDSVRVALPSSRVVQGNEANISVTVRPAGVRCALAVKYANGSRQGGLAPVAAVGGRATWRWTVPITTKAGRATATVSCGRAGRVKRARHIQVAKTPRCPGAFFYVFICLSFCIASQSGEEA